MLGMATFGFLLFLRGLACFGLVLFAAESSLLGLPLFLHGFSRPDFALLVFDFLHLELFMSLRSFVRPGFSAFVSGAAVLGQWVWQHVALSRCCMVLLGLALSLLFWTVHFQGFCFL